MLKGFSLRFSNMAVPGTAWNLLKTTCGLTRKWQAHHFKKLTWEPKSWHSWLSPCPESPWLHWKGWTTGVPPQPAGHNPATPSADAPSCSSQQQQDRHARTAAAKQPGWASSPQPRTSTDRAASTSLSHIGSPARLPAAAPAAQGPPRPWPRPAPPPRRAQRALQGQLLCRGWAAIGVLGTWLTLQASQKLGITVFVSPRNGIPTKSSWKIKEVSHHILGTCFRKQTRKQ